MQENLETELKCAVCLDLLKLPHQPDCGHSFCLTCIIDCITSNGKFCPTCRMEFNLIFPCFALNKVLESIVKEKNSKNVIDSTFCNTEDQFIRGLNYHKQKQYSKAIKCYNLAIEHSFPPPNTKYYENRAQCYYDLRLWNLALADCEKAINSKNNSTISQQLKIECLKQLGKTKQESIDNEGEHFLSDNIIFACLSRNSQQENPPLYIVEEGKCCLQ